MTQSTSDNVYLSLSFPSIPKATADAVRAAAEQAAGDVDVNVSYGQAIQYDEGWLDENQAPAPTTDQPVPEVPTSAPVLENNGGSTADPSSSAVDAPPVDTGTPTGADTSVPTPDAPTSAAAPDVSADAATPAPDAAPAPVEAAPATTDVTTPAPDATPAPDSAAPTTDASGDGASSAPLTPNL